MKKTLSLLLALVLCLSLCSCGGATDSPETAAVTVPTETEPPMYQIGDTVATDIVEFTLDEAQLAIALSSVFDETYCAPKEYNVDEDARNPFVCAKGHTYAAFTYTIRNLDRTSFNGKLPLVSAEYLGVQSDKQVDGAEYNADRNEWITTGNNPTSPVYGWYFVLEVGEAKQYRSFIDVPVEATDLSDDFCLFAELPNSDGTTTTFTYLVTQN